MSVKDQRKLQIFDILCHSDKPMTRMDISRALGFKSRIPSPYLIELLETMVTNKDGITKVVFQTKNNRQSWGYQVLEQVSETFR